MRINNLSPVNNVYTTSQPTVANAEVSVPPQVVASIDLSAKNDNDLNSVEPHETSLEPISEELLERSIQQANRNLVYQNRVIERAVHDVTKVVMYTVKDTVTHEVIAEFPPKRIQDMIAKMWELAGLFVDEKA